MLTFKGCTEFITCKTGTKLKYVGVTVYGTLLSFELMTFHWWPGVAKKGNNFGSKYSYLHTGCPISKVPLACFLGFPCSYRGSFHHFSIAQETTIPKLTLLSSLRQKLIKLQSKT